MRNRDGMLVQRRVRKAKLMHAFGGNGANREDAEDEETRLPPPDQHLLTILDEIDTGSLVEKYIEFCTDDGRSVHLPPVFVAPIMKGLPDDLPTVDAIATLPLVMPNGDWLANPGLDRNHGILFKIDPAIQRLMPRPEECNSDRVAEAMHFLTEEWFCDVATPYNYKCILVAAALTIIERTLFPERPDFYITAGRRGGGKTTALTMLIMAVMGVRPAAAAWTKDENERKKALFSYLLEGVPYILWDKYPAGDADRLPAYSKKPAPRTQSRIAYYVRAKPGLPQQRPSIYSPEITSGQRAIPSPAACRFALRSTAPTRKTDHSGTPIRSDGQRQTGPRFFRRSTRSCSVIQS